MTISHAFAGGTLTLWWDKPDCGECPEKYDIVINGESLTADRTHITAGPFGTGEDCHARVSFRGETLGEIHVTAPGPFRQLNVRDFGAAGDGAAWDTSALQAAIDRCGPDEEVYLPAGIYRTGALWLHSGMALHIDKGAVLQGSEDPKDYLPMIPSRFEGIERECLQSLLNLGHMDHAAGADCRGVLIYGGGVIAGGGKALADHTIAWEKARLAALKVSGPADGECESADTVPGRARGRLINMSNCEDIRVTGLTLRDGPGWNVHMLYCRGIVTDHCTFISKGIWNGDGWDPDSSEDCILFACDFSTGDDAVAIKSGKNPEGNRIARPAKNIRVFDCVSRFGLGIAIGSEMSGGVEDVRIWDCDLRRSLYGVQIKGTKKRGGYVRDITVTDCVLSRFTLRAVAYNDDGEGAAAPPKFSRMALRRVRLTGWAREYWEKEDHPVPAIELGGFDEEGFEAEDIVCEKCRTGGGQISVERCRNVSVIGLEALEDDPADRAGEAWW